MKLLSGELLLGAQVVSSQHHVGSRGAVHGETSLDGGLGKCHALIHGVMVISSLASGGGRPCPRLGCGQILVRRDIFCMLLEGTAGILEPSMASPSSPDEFLMLDCASKFFSSASSLGSLGAAVNH